MTTYADTLKFLYSQLPMYQRSGSTAIKKGLGNIRALLEFLDRPEKRFQTIHIAGTNGKGTVSHMLAACYQASGRKVGLYTSPHYRDFRERIKIDGAMISKRDVVRFVEKIRPCLDDIKPSFFEITVALAFDAFDRHDVDLAIVETGLGGRLDSTNVITPLISVITNISFDHTQMLGNTLPAIAKEKAGIIKKGVPVVIGTHQRETAAVFKNKAMKTGSKVSYACKSLSAELLIEDWEYQAYRVSRKGEVIFDQLQLGCAGPFQRENLVTTLHTVMRAREAGLEVSDKSLRDGLRDIRQLTGYQGRWQVIAKDPVVLCDSAHNKSGLAKVMAHVKRHHAGDLHCVLGFVQDKDIEELLALCPKRATYYFASPDVPRGAKVDNVTETAMAIGLHCNKYTSVRRALAAAKRVAKVKDMIYVGGSTFVVAEVL